MRADPEVVCRGGLHPLLQPRPLLRRLGRVVRPGQLVAIELARGAVCSAHTGPAAFGYHADPAAYRTRVKSSSTLVCRPSLFCMGFPYAGETRRSGNQGTQPTAARAWAVLSLIHRQQARSFQHFWVNTWISAQQNEIILISSLNTTWFFFGRNGKHRDWAESGKLRCRGRHDGCGPGSVTSDCPTPITESNSSTSSSTDLPPTWDR